MSNTARDSAFRRSSDNDSLEKDAALADRDLASGRRSDDAADRDVVADHLVLQGGDAGTKGTGSSG